MSLPTLNEILSGNQRYPIDVIKLVLQREIKLIPLIKELQFKVRKAKDGLYTPFDDDARIEDINTTIKNIMQSDYDDDSIECILIAEHFQTVDDCVLSLSDEHFFELMSLMFIVNTVEFRYLYQQKQIDMKNTLELVRTTKHYADLEDLIKGEFESYLHRNETIVLKKMNKASRWKHLLYGKSTAELSNNDIRSLVNTPEHVRSRKIFRC